MSEKMKTVCHTENTIMSYPEVSPGATAWAWSDEQPVKGDTITVTAHGLRRLLRIASRAWPFIAEKRLGPSDLYKERTTPEAAASLANEISAVWCEGDLIMSRLFVDDEGRAIAHKDKESDDDSIPPWERSDS